MFLVHSRMGVRLSALTMAAVFAGSGRAQPQILAPAPSGLPEVAKAVVVKMTLHAAAAPVPAMKYHLLPEVRDLKPGNAALLYERGQSMEWWSNFIRSGESEKMYAWLELPLSKMPRDKVVLLGGPLAEVDLAARREYCDWELTPRLYKKGYALVLPDVQGFRSYGLMLALRARTQMLDGKLDQAVDGLQTGFALSRHISEAPLIINAMVGLGVGNMMLDRVEEFVQVDKAPNLYWGLTDLPRPFINLRQPLQGEKVGVDSVFPDIRAALHNPNLPPIPMQTIDAALRNHPDLGSSNQVTLALLAARAYPSAKQYLLEHGFSIEQVTALPVTQVSLMYAVALYDESYDDAYKWHSFPYWQARPGLTKANQLFRQRRSEQLEAMALVSSLTPAMNGVMFAQARVDRRLAMLRIVEAFRLYASHDGKLPARLDDIREVPIPIDAVTGKPFEYTVNGAGAVLYAGPPEGETASDHNAVRYEITLAK